jgi:hypothetical protein
MTKVFQKYRKMFLAIFGVALMIVFVLPATTKNRQYHRETAFTVGKDEVSLADKREAIEQLRLINSVVGQNVLAGISRDIERKPELFLLYQIEARRMGLRASDTEAREMMTGLRRSGMRLPPDQALLPAFKNLLLVQSLFRRVAEGVKLSEPQILHEMARHEQRLKLDVVHYDADDFKKEVKAPTEEQIQQQFDRYKNTPSTASEQNPFGFGYLVPAQVKLLYVTVPRSEVARVVRASRDTFTWERDAMVQYKTHQADYPVTQPTSAPVAGPGIKPAAEPTTRPFADVKQQIVDELMKPEIERKLEDVAIAVKDRLTADYKLHEKKSPEAPADFGKREYLEAVAKQIEEKFGVRIGVSEINDPKTAEGLADLKGIGKSFLGMQPFSPYVMRWAEPFVPEGQRKSDDVLSLSEPSKRLRDAEGSQYFFQVTSAEPAHAPANLAAVRDQVVYDIKTQLAFEAAKAAATKLKDAAATTGLAAAAKAAGKDVFPTPDYVTIDGRMSGKPAVLIPRVTLPDAANRTLITRAFDLLADATTDKPHPRTVVELPNPGRVAVLELTDVERSWTDDDRKLWEVAIAQQIARERTIRLLQEYFSFDAVKQRLELNDPSEKQEKQPS